MIRTIKHAGLALLFTALLLPATARSESAADESGRNPFLTKSSALIKPDFDLAASLVRLHGLVLVGDEKRAIISIELSTGNTLDFLTLAGSKRLRVLVDGTEYGFTAQLTANGVALTGDNKKKYVVEL